MSTDRDTEIEAWAARIAATLPPFTASEAAAVGRMAAVLDARRAQGKPKGERRRPPESEAKAA